MSNTVLLRKVEVGVTSGQVIWRHPPDELHDL